MPIPPRLTTAPQDQSSGWVRTLLREFPGMLRTHLRHHWRAYLGRGLLAGTLVASALPLLVLAYHADAEAFSLAWHLIAVTTIFCTGMCLALGPWRLAVWGGVFALVLACLPRLVVWLHTRVEWPQ